MTYSSLDKKMMVQALALAEKGLGKTWPNPLVGAVIVKNQKIIGSGWHRRYGGHHAENYALRQAGSLARQGTLYVTLEPCSHFGHTPPCALAVIRAGIKRVVCAMRDPNPRVSGRGFRLLRQAGIEVNVGLMESAALELNKVFVKNMTTGMPYVIAKTAQSLDGKIACASGVSRWISGRKAREYSHQLRSVVDAIIIGAGTVLADDPELSVRSVKRMRPQPLIRIVLTGKRRLPDSARILHTPQQPLIIVEGRSTKKEQSRFYGENIEYWCLPGKNGRVDLQDLLKKLWSDKISLVLVEGGADIHAAFFGLDGSPNINLVDEIHCIVAPRIIGGRHAVTAVGGLGALTPDNGLALQTGHWQPLGTDWLFVTKPKTVNQPRRQGM